MIYFTKPIDQDKLRMAYNNDVVEFYSNTTTEPLYATVQDTDGGMNITLYPNPDGKFFLNLKPYITALINTRNFEDLTETELQSPDTQSFIYNFYNGTVLSTGITFTVWLSDNVNEAETYLLRWLAGAEQLNNYNSFIKGGSYLLSPFKPGTTNQYCLKYWEGYPFDIPIYFTGKELTVKNLTNLIDAEFGMGNTASRIFISDGRTSETLEDVLPLVDGYNELLFIGTNLLDPNRDKTLYLEKIPYKCGVYVKWLNKYGGYSYWLFENIYSLDRSGKQLGELDRDLANLEDTFTRAIQIGRETQDSIRVVAELLTEDEKTILEGIADSPKIYLFTGQPLARNSYRDWIEVTLKTSNIRLRNPKQPLTNFTLDFELPVRYTQTL